MARPLIKVGMTMLMGDDIFSEEDLIEFQKLTYLSRKQITRLYSTFCSCNPIIQNPKNPILPWSSLLTMPELAVNPFRDRIAKVFSSEPDFMTFEDFLDMMSVFSDSAPLNIKTSYAFRIYDFDEDDLLGEEDVTEMLLRLRPGVALCRSDIEEVVDHVFKESDLDADGYISYSEFEHLIAKSPDFYLNFQIRA